jgi:hypothetical protein
MICQPLKTKNKMKTQKNISNLKKLAATAFAVLIMTVGSFTQLRAAGNESAEIESLSRLENTMKSIEQSVRYTAPSVNETEELSAGMVRLEMVALATEAMLKYEAPAVEETEAIADIAERLEMIAAATEASLKYEAPVVDYTETVAPELERLEMTADATVATLRYEAPAVDEINASESTIEISENMMATKNK